MKAANKFQWAYVRQYYLQKSDLQISQDLGISEETVKRIREKNGLKRGVFTEEKIKQREQLSGIMEADENDGLYQDETPEADGSAAD